jgi:hypothetical protein
MDSGKAMEEFSNCYGSALKRQQTCERYLKHLLLNRLRKMLKAFRKHMPHSGQRFLEVHAGMNLRWSGPGLGNKGLLKTF